MVMTIQEKIKRALATGEFLFWEGKSIDIDKISTQLATLFAEELSVYDKALNLATSNNAIKKMDCLRNALNLKPTGAFSDGYSKNVVNDLFDDVFGIIVQASYYLNESDKDGNTVRKYNCIYLDEVVDRLYNLFRACGANVRKPNTFVEEYRHQRFFDKVLYFALTPSTQAFVKSINGAVSPNDDEIEAFNQEVENLRLKLFER